jgi:hypothetical protein
MKPEVPVHLCVMQPAGYVHAMALLDAAVYFKHQFERLGARVSLAKNRLRHDAINFVFGAHLGFDAAQAEHSNCVIVNLEQLGSNGAQLPPRYLELLRRSAVVDYDAGNIEAYRGQRQRADIPLVSFSFAPYLRQAHPLAAELAQRPIDLLFFGSMNERRQALIQRIEACGLSVSLFDGPLYGPERDAYILQAKAVLNCHFYDSARFEQVRAFQTLSLGTPLICERTPATQAGDLYDTCAMWFDEAHLEHFFSQEFGSELFYQVAQQQLEAFAGSDTLEQFAEVLAFGLGTHLVDSARRTSGPRTVRQLHIGSGKSYRQGWFNIDIQASTRPDALLDLSRQLELPMLLSSPYAGPSLLAPGEVEHIHADNVLEHVHDLPRLMGNCLDLLCTGGRFTIEVPHERGLGAWQDPTHVRAMNENSWLYYTDWFWYLGWFEHRFQLEAMDYLDARLQVCERGVATFMRVALVKVPRACANA